MPKLEIHLQDGGDRDEEIHKWVDEFSMINGEFNKYHRRHRHHKEGIMEAINIFGEQARPILEQHILRDCGHIPNQKDYELEMVSFEGKQ